MWISVAALLIFCFSHATMKNIINQQTHWTTSSSCSQIIDTFRVLSAALVAVSLLSIFLPDPIWWLFFVIRLLLASFIVARHFFKFQCTWIYLGVIMKTTVQPAARCFA
ncbi:hypothetical protein FH972_010993 [Carpinus fangiana]|uniref:Uncharacterized protein n=1 Tax=Carpinus fangiana TaxID=176857 RepID=A0A660KW25_9ROSI|nr:hypothetical protein FH972_010993 [Carpinus fangiana]